MADDKAAHCATTDADMKEAVAGRAQGSREAKTRLVRGGDGRWGLARASRLENNLSWVVGCLELANAGDFAANVWNEVPVPVYAVVFMALGGTVAAVVAVFALLDSRRAWANVRFLWRQRRRLREERRRGGGPEKEPGEPGEPEEPWGDGSGTEPEEPPGDGSDTEPAAAAAPPDAATAAVAAVVFRELWSEVINRWAMDVLMGGGALLIAAGTYMAIGGADDKVWLASNILSGYLGNAPMAVFGLANALWAAYVWTKAQGHVSAARRALGRGSRAARLVKRRARSVQVFCAVNGCATVVGGGASLLTATRWWAYVVLAPVVVASVCCNLWWRRRVGYTRAAGSPDGAPAVPVPGALVGALEAAARAATLLREGAPLERLGVDAGGLRAVLAFARRHALLDDVCVAAAADPELCGALGGGAAPERGSEPEPGPDPPPELVLGEAELLALPAPLHPRLLGVARDCIARVGPQHFRHRERYLAELLGSYCVVAGDAGLFPEKADDS